MFLFIIFYKNKWKNITWSQSNWNFLSTGLSIERLEFLSLSLERLIIGKHYSANEIFNLFTSCLLFLLFSLSIDLSLWCSSFCWDLKIRCFYKVSLWFFMSSSTFFILSCFFFRSSSEDFSWKVRILSAD